MNRELDELVAEKVFKWKTVTVPPDGAGENGGTEMLVPHGYDMKDTSRWGTLPPKGLISRGFFAHLWSSDRQRALEVVRHMEATGLENFIRELEFEIVKGGGPRIADCRCNSCLIALMLATPEQICRAAVEACK